MKITEDIFRKVIRSEIKKTLITESSPGFTKREFGDPLPKDVGIEIDKQVIREIKRTLPKSKLHKIVLGK